MNCETTFECRGCGKNALGNSDGRIIGDCGWGRLMRIDGPNTICPACIHDRLDDIILRFREDGYDHVFVIQEVAEAE